MKTIYFIIAISGMILTTGVTSCTKHKGDFEENIPSAVISISSPVANAIYHKEDSIHIDAVAISSATIHGYDISIKKANDTTTLFFNHIHDHNDTLLISQRWRNTIIDAADFEARITLYLDHDGHTSTKRVKFKVQ